MSISVLICTAQSIYISRSGLGFVRAKIRFKGFLKKKNTLLKQTIVRKNDYISVFSWMQCKDNAFDKIQAVNVEA